MKKLLTLLIAMGLSVAAYADPVSDGDAGDLNGADDAVSIAGTISPIDIGDIFSLNVIGTSKGPGGSLDTIDVGLGMNFGTEIDGSPAGYTAGDDAGLDVNGTDVNPDDPRVYKNMLRLAGPRFNDHLVFMSQNRGLNLTLTVTFAGNILTLRTPGADAADAGTPPYQTAYYNDTPGLENYDTWSGNNDHPIHMTVIPWGDPVSGYGTADTAALQTFTNGTAIDGPIGVGNGTDTVTLYQTSGPAFTGASDGFEVITALDFISIKAGSAGVGGYTGTCTWNMVGA